MESLEYKEISKQILFNKIKAKEFKDFLDKIEGLGNKEDERISIGWLDRTNFFKRMGVIEIENDKGYIYESAFLWYNSNNIGVFVTAYQDLNANAVIYLIKENAENEIFKVEFDGKQIIKVIQTEYCNFYIVEEDRGFEDIEPINLFFCFYDDNVRDTTMLCGGISVTADTKVIINYNNLILLKPTEDFDLIDTAEIYFQLNDCKLEDCFNNEDKKTFTHTIQTSLFQRGCLIYEAYENETFVIYGMHFKDKSTKTKFKNEAIKFNPKDFDKIQETLQEMFLENHEENYNITLFSKIVDENVTKKIIYEIL